MSAQTVPPIVAAQSSYSRHAESDALISASADQLFARLDDHTRVSSHMSKPSWRMGGGSMETILDEGKGRVVGSHIVLRGRVFGIALEVDEVVTVREPPRRKVWQTVGEPHLLVIGSYRMSFDLQPEGNGARLRVAIDYELPTRGVARLLGMLFGRMYAVWCTRQMVTDASRSTAGSA